MGLLSQSLRKLKMILHFYVLQSPLVAALITVMFVGGWRKSDDIIIEQPLRNEVVVDD